MNRGERCGPCPLPVGPAVCVSTRGPTELGLGTVCSGHRGHPGCSRAQEGRPRQGASGLLRATRLQLPRAPDWAVPRHGAPSGFCLGAHLPRWLRAGPAPPELRGLELPSRGPGSRTFSPLRCHGLSSGVRASSLSSAETREGSQTQPETVPHTALRSPGAVEETGQAGPGALLGEGAPLACSPQLPCSEVQLLLLEKTPKRS